MAAGRMMKVVVRQRRQKPVGQKEGAVSGFPISEETQASQCSGGELPVSYTSQDIPPHVQWERLAYPGADRHWEDILLLLCL